MSQQQDSETSRIIGHSPVRLAFVGGGRVTETCHLPALAGLKQAFEVVALAEPDEHTRKRVAGMFGIPQTFARLDDLLRTGSSIDAVAICTPAVAHAEAALAALDAGKHLLVEKPIALSLEDADRIILRASERRLKAVMGFNLRNHRLVRKARQMIQAGVVGDVHLIRSVWTSGIRTRMQVPTWRGRRTTGGGAISEIAVHHIDLVRFLTGSDIAQVFAESQHGDADDEVAALTLRLSNGATVTSAFTERSGDSNEMEIIGSKGRLNFSIYQFDSLRFTPIGSYGGRGGRMIQSVKDLIEAWPVLRRGGDFKETYRAQWEAFGETIRNNRPPVATLADGREALRVVLAAGASSNRGQPVAIHDAPHRPEPVAGRPESAPQRLEPDPGAPKIAALLSTRGSFDSIARTVKHLRAQTIRESIELVITCPAQSELKLDESAVAGFHSHQIVEIGPFDSAAPANAAGTRAAKAPIVVFCEDHSFPDPNWAENLLLAHRGPYVAVGPAVHNANPGTLVSRADFIIGYGAWAEPIKPCEPRHLPGHNSSYKKQVLLEYGDRLAQVLEAESVMHWEMVGKGYRLYLDPTARLAHTNFAKLGIWTKVQYHAGRLFGGTRSIGWPLWKRLFYVAASPLIPVVRFKRIWGDARRARSSGMAGPGVLLMLIWGLILDGLGQMVGYALGMGDSKGIAHEFCRVHHITEADRQRLAAAEQTGTAL